MIGRGQFGDSFPSIHPQMRCRLPLTSHPLRLLVAAVAFPVVAAGARAQSWCAHPPRDAYARLERVAVTDRWFQVYRVDPGVFALYEPFNFQRSSPT